jgi:hypothetical protein
VVHEDKQEMKERLTRARDFVKMHYSKQRLLNDMEDLFGNLAMRRALAKSRWMQPRSGKDRASKWVDICVEKG